MQPLVSVIVPCRNEIRYIGAFLESVAAFECPPGAVEVLIADGSSSDGTREFLDAYAAVHGWLRVIPNPNRIVSSGLNTAIREARGSIIIRLDVHATFAPDYIVECLRVLNETGADNVGGPARTRAHGYMQRAIAAAYHSPFACGGARFHDVNYEGLVDTVTFGCWRKELFDRVGLFDETLIRNQDDEHNLRIALKGGLEGGKIFQSPRIRCWYETRSSLPALFSQYRQYGYWKVPVIRKHGRPASWRHLVPATFVGTLTVLAVFAPFSYWARFALVLTGGAWLALSMVATLIICLPRQLKLLPVMPLVLATYHVSYGLGFLGGLLMPRQRGVR